MITNDILSNLSNEAIGLVKDTAIGIGLDRSLKHMTGFSPFESTKDTLRKGLKKGTELIRGKTLKDSLNSSDNSRNGQQHQESVDGFDNHNNTSSKFVSDGNGGMKPNPNHKSSIAEKLVFDKLGFRVDEVLNNGED
jgi:hypothetical protein